MDQGPIVSAIAIYNTSTGAHIVNAPAGAALRAGQSSISLPSGYTPEIWIWDATKRAMVESLPKLKDYLVAAIKVDAEQKKMALLSAGGAKKAEYAEKRQEVISYDALATGVGGIVQAMTTLATPRRKVMLAHAEADAAAHGDTVAAAIERFRGGISRASTTPLIAAAEAAACDAIRAATTVAAARAVVVKWPAIAAT